MNMKNYYRIMLGRGSVHSPVCFAEGFVGVDGDLQRDLGPYLTDELRPFIKAMAPVYRELYPGLSKIVAGQSASIDWTVCKGMQIGDTVLSPDGRGTYRVGEVVSDYQYVPDGVLPNRRQVRWLDAAIPRADMSDALKGSTGSTRTIVNLSAYRDEIERFLGGKHIHLPVPADEVVEDAAAFALEKHLEDFLVQNWAQTDLGRDYDIYTENGEVLGQQYPTDTGPMDILAIKKDKSELLVVELKKGRASDAVVGQVLRYMGYAAQELAETNQKVRGVIIALEDDQRIRRALAVSPNIDFFRYQISFKLIKG
jgi:restriction system protein